MKHQSGNSSRRRTFNMPECPAELSVLSKSLGLKATLLLVEAFGGTRIEPPTVPKPGQKLWEALGPDTARALSQEYANTLVHIPSCKHWRVKVYAAQGLNYAEIARKLGWDECTVYRALRDRKAAPRHSEIDA